MKREIRQEQINNVTWTKKERIKKTEGFEKELKNITENRENNKNEKERPNQRVNKNYMNLYQWRKQKPKLNEGTKQRELNLFRT